MGSPAQASLDAWFARATRVKVTNVVGHEEGPLAVAEGRDVERLRKLLRIHEDGPVFHCMCRGDLELTLDAGGAPFATLSFHHARSLRHQEWSSDAMLVDGPGLVRWLADHGAPGPLLEYEAELERDRLGDEARRLWLSNTPPCLAPDLRRFEVDEHGMPLSATAPALDEAERRVRAAYATPAQAAFTLLAWYGEGAGRWSGYPSYEGLAEHLLFRLGVPVAIEAAGTASSAVLLGVARLLSSFELVTYKKHQLGGAPEGLWDRLRPLVTRSGIADNVARFEGAAAIAAEHRRMRARPEPVPVGALVLVGVSEKGPLSGLVTDGVRLYAGDDGDVVVFAPGSTAPRVLYASDDPFFELATPVSKMLMVAHINAGTVGKILTEDGRFIVMAREQARPTSLVVVRGVMAWINQAQVADPDRGAPYVVQRSSVMAFEAPSARVLRVAPFSAFSLVGDQCHLYWCEIEAGQLRVFRHAHFRDEPPAIVADVGPHAGSFPRLAVGPTHVFFADEERRVIVAIDKRGGTVGTLAETHHRPTHVIADEHDVFALTCDDHVGYVEHVGPSGARVLADYPRPSFDRPALALTRQSLFFTTRDRVLALVRA